ncbi:hypothetical protein [Sphingobacterium psychroaquaticum]|nr:hypothetical protein [Sphingobacterium psychroaquaticum]
MKIKKSGKAPPAKSKLHPSIAQLIIGALRTGKVNVIATDKFHP